MSIDPGFFTVEAAEEFQRRHREVMHRRRDQGINLLKEALRKESADESRGFTVAAGVDPLPLSGVIEDAIREGVSFRQFARQLERQEQVLAKHPKERG